ncbi:gluconate 2-dehydrogenase subunit 3 family protein [Membranihabitans maritimus]|uniref:gluconate 2-dehydrogenase subunit 3 family protein n=1 Tax=Membranihabitans maritimus TaxID=2904244 RepID=UPI001F1DBAB6|nr:gluconate 2-dehydrogenase subunit 3 family protein [Membranihabitans maritimus]
MDRRETIKALMAGSVASSFVITSCGPDESTMKNAKVGTENGEGFSTIETGAFDLDKEGHGYGRTPEEEAYDVKLLSDTFFNEHEMATIAILADIIIPADDVSGSATDAGVPEFIEFIVKDMPYHQIPVRGGLMWLDHESNKRFNKVFKDLSDQQRIDIVDDIAYPKDVKPEFTQGTKFFSHIRNLVATGFFSSKMGIEDIGYVGNTPNVWDGVPEDVLKKHNKSYDEKYMDQYIKPDQRNEIASWD